MWKREERIVVVVKRSLNSHSRFIEEDAIRLLRNDPSKVDLWRSFEGQQGGIQFRLTEKEKKTDFAASPTGRILWLCRLSYSFFFLSFFPSVSVANIFIPSFFRWHRASCLGTSRSFGYRRRSMANWHRSSRTGTIACAHSRRINHVPKVLEAETTKRVNIAVQRSLKRPKEIETRIVWRIRNCSEEDMSFEGGLENLRDGWPELRRISRSTP